MASVSTISSELDTSEKYCVFECGNQVFAILATSISEVGLRPNLAEVPSAHGSLVGLGRVRNEFVPLLRMDSGRTQATEPQMVVVSGEHGPWGLMVDRVIGLSSLEVSLGSDSRGGEGCLAAVMGSATLDGRVVKIVDERALYRYSANVLNQFWASATAS